MKKNIIFWSLVLFTLSFNTCNNYDIDEEKEKTDYLTSFELIKNQELSFNDYLIPNLVEVKNNIATIGFIKSAQLYSITLTDNYSYQCIEFIKKAIQSKEYLEVQLLKDSKEIGKIKQIPKEKQFMLEAMTAPPTEPVLSLRARTKKALYYEDALLLISEGKKIINFEYLSDGCYARAHAMYRHFKRFYSEYYCQKVFAFGFLSYYSTKYSCYTGWRYHVAFCVSVVAGPFKELKIIDPGLSDVPLSHSEWINLLLSLPNNYLESTFFTEPEVYYREGGTILYDNHYFDTDATLERFKLYKGC